MSDECYNLVIDMMERFEKHDLKGQNTKTKSKRWKNHQFGEIECKASSFKDLRSLSEEEF